MNPKPAAVVPTTPAFDFIYGYYHLSDWRLPYLSTTMTLRQVATSLNLVSDFPGSERLNWDLDELFQRDIDWPRVEREIVPYLRSNDRPQFFNSLTIALLPIANNEIKASFKGESWHPPEPNGQFAKHLVVGPVILEYWNDWMEVEEPFAKLGQIRWNTSEVFSVAIDGQHRLAAIKAYCKELEKDPKIDNTYVSVILLIFDKRIGVLERVSMGDQLKLLRSLFIDLNKHAKQVSRTRQIILDDLDPHSLCVRSLVGSTLQDGAKELIQENPRLPLNLVDWHTEQAKFDEGPYFSTVLGLDWIVTTALGSKPIRDFMDYREVKKQIDAFERSLGVDLSNARTRVDSYEKLNMQPFTYRDSNGENELKAIRDAFQRVWCPGLAKFFAEISPYKELILRREAMKTLGPDFVTWYYLWTRKEKDPGEGQASIDYKKYISHLATRERNKIGESELKAKLVELNGLKRDNLAFNVIFQKALIEAYVEYRKLEEEPENEDLSDEEIEELDNVLEEDLSEAPEEPSIGVDSVAEKALVGQSRTTEFIEAINKVISAHSDFLNVACRVSEGKDSKFLWLGTLRTAEGAIDFTAGAAHRARDIILWIAYVNKCASTKDEILGYDFGDMLEALEESKSSVHRRLRSAILRFMSDRAGSALSRILKGQDEDYSEEVASSETKARFVWITQSVGTKD